MCVCVCVCVSVCVVFVFRMSVPSACGLYSNFCLLIVVYCMQ